MKMKKAVSEGGQNMSNKSAYREIRKKNKLWEKEGQRGRREESKERAFNILNLRKQLPLSCNTPTKWRHGKADRRKQRR